MNELYKHIEVLLLENDCVIVPNLGGFIAHHRAASYDEQTGDFFPPMRTIGFNPQLTMNDGLLVQSYMRTYNTDFPDATRKIEKAVCTLKDTLYEESEVSIGHVGTLFYNMNGTYEFEPAEATYFTPSLYGLQQFCLPKLSDLDAQHPKQEETATAEAHPINTKGWIVNAAAVAAAILLFFLFPTQVENTYINDADYASLGTEGLFSAIRNQSMLSNSLSKETRTTATSARTQTHKPQTKKKAAITPVSVRVEKVPAKRTDAVTGATTPVKQKQEKTSTKPAPKEKGTKETKKQGKQNKFHIIVASLNSAKDAQAEAERLQKEGYTRAQVLTSDKRFRVSIGSFDNEAEAYKKTNETRQTPGMESVWVYTQKQ